MKKEVSIFSFPINSYYKTRDAIDGDVIQAGKFVHDNLSGELLIRKGQYDIYKKPLTENRAGWKIQRVILTTDNEIKKGDYFYDTVDKIIHEACYVKEAISYQIQDTEKPKMWHDKKNCHLIIAAYPKFRDFPLINKTFLANWINKPVPCVNVEYDQYNRSTTWEFDEPEFTELKLTENNEVICSFPKENKADWVFERQSGYAGYRNTKTGVWIYNEEYQKMFSVKYFTEEEFRSIISAIYSEFAELDASRYYPHELKRIIEQEVEQHPIKPIQIFKK
jgi:hypothetical protein